MARERSPALWLHTQPSVTRKMPVCHRILLLLWLLHFSSVYSDITDGNAEHLKREHSLIKPYQGVGTSPSSQWDFWGSTLVTSQYVRLTPDERSKQGSIWNTVPCYLKDWEMHVQFKVHGSGKKNLHGDGFAIWYTKERLHPGTVFGSSGNFHGLAIFIDTYPNDEAPDRSFPYISAMVSNGSLPYDHGKDGRSTELGGCSVEVRNKDHDTYLAVRYSKGRLTIMVDVDDRNDWRECIDIGGVRLPTGYYFGSSAATGDLSDNHDIISMKMYQLMVEHTPEEDNQDWTKIEPSTILMIQPEIFGAHPSLAGRSSHYFCVPCWELWFMRLLVLWSFRSVRRGTRGSTKHLDFKELD
ncbi:hypothetical protein PO909_006740 [Leuciscus waleckii]